MNIYYKKRIAPRLANGDSRVSFGHGLPEEIKEALRRIAYKEKKSMSWVMEEVIIDYFELKTPNYKEKEIKNETNKKARS